ncbi:hypothetical protein G6F65_022983 [Rhizopus arrhizus]|nr:hypothetical protein G6F65_022983 [Rhizopus arrhizus]
MLADQRHGRRRRHDQHHGHRPLPVRDLHLAPEAAGDRGDAHEAAVGIQRGDRDLAEGDAEATSRPANWPAAMAAASTPSTIAICAPPTAPRPTARNVFVAAVALGR